MVHEYPIKTQTFVENEALAVEKLGHQISRYALHPGPGLTPGWPAVITARSAIADWRGLVTWVTTAGRAANRYRRISAILVADRFSPRDFARQVFALGHAISLVSHLRRQGEENVHLHAHFLGRCLDVVTYAAIILSPSATTSATGHAADARNVTTPRRFRKQVRRLDAVFCASKSVARVLEDTTERQATAIIHCGITPKPESMGSRPPATSIRILTVARLVEKKGIFDCLSAARALHRQGTHFEWRFIGDGPLFEDLKRESKDLSDKGKIIWMGAQPPKVVHLQLESWADIFVLPSKQSSDGDVDGIPVALMEAMTSEVAVVSSQISGIPELIADAKTGLLIEPGNVEQLVLAIKSLQEKEFRSTISEAAKRFVDVEFNQDIEASKIAKVMIQEPISPASVGH